MNYSLTTGSLLVVVLGTVLQHLGLQDVNAQDVISAVGLIAQVLGAAGAYYGRYRHGDITWYGKKLN